MTATASPATDRHVRKRIAARIRQQRCRARKREAKIMQAARDAGSVGSQPGDHAVRGQVLTLRDAGRFGLQFPLHPRSPFGTYAGGGGDTRLSPESPQVWTTIRAPQSFPSSPMRVFTILPESCRTPPTQRSNDLPRVSPVQTLQMPVFPSLVGKEETAIDAMLSLRGSAPSSPQHAYRTTIHKIPSLEPRRCFP